ncbi:MAG: hypothetical protein HYU69_05795 [Bacteroidetes bacterium]|nr:hypothetical protein [Bacteroidota bacterium]
MIRIRAFRSIDELKTCEAYLEGHRKVLTDYNITQITTNTNEWFYNPSVYGIVVESMDCKEVYGGTRIQVKESNILLPFEEAILELDNKVLTTVEEYSKTGTGELCGLWNSRKMSGKGYSVLLTRAAIARASLVLAERLKLKSIFVLCGPYTVQLAKSMGFVPEESLGNNGTFIYPRPDLIASLLVIKDMEHLKSADPNQRKDILSLRHNPKQTRIEMGPKGEIEVEYDLRISSIEDINSKI